MHARRSMGMALAALALMLGCDDAVQGAPADAIVEPDAIDAAPEPPADMARPPLDAAMRPPDAASPVPPTAMAVAIVTVRAEPVPLDLLWIIDDSRSMCGEVQARLPAEIEAFADALAAAAPTLDLAVAATTTDVRRGRGLDGRFVVPLAGPLPAPACIDPATGLPLVPSTIDCEARAATGRLAPVSTWGAVEPDGREQGAACADADCRRDALRFTLRCMTAGGLRGSDFEAGLDAIMRATACDGPNGDRLGHCCADGEPCAPQLLRPGAARAVIVVADQDDCSPGSDFDGAEAGNCVWLASALAPIDEYVQHLRALAGPEAPVGLFVWGGPPAVAASGAEARWRTFDPVVDPPGCDPDIDPEADFAAWSAGCCDDDGVCIGPARTTCAVGDDGAHSTPRYHAVAAALGTAFEPTLCDEGAGPALARKVVELARSPRAICLAAAGLDDVVAVRGRCLDGMPCAEDGWVDMPLDAIRMALGSIPGCDGIAVEPAVPLQRGAELQIEHRAALPAGEPVGCGVPGPCVEHDEAVSQGYRVHRAWRCAATEGVECLSACVVGLGNADAPQCTMACQGPEDCPVGRCHVLAGPCDAPDGVCYCGL